MEAYELSLEKVSNFRDRLLEYMKKKKFRQCDIVKLTGLNKSTLNNYLSGYRYEPSKDKMELIANKLNVSLAWLEGYNCSEIPVVYNKYYDPNKKITAVDKVLGFGLLREIFEKTKDMDYNDLQKVITFIDMISNK